MKERETKIIKIPELTRVEGHAAVVVDIAGGKVESVKLDVFEGIRFFERILLGHKYHEIPHIASRVCAICSAGHILAAISALEPLMEYRPTPLVRLLRELIHLGMIIESHATHLFALALPDYIGCADLTDFVSNHPKQFQSWTTLRNLGSRIQECIGGRAFHPVNLYPGGFGRYPTADELQQILPLLAQGKPLAIEIAEFFGNVKPEFHRATVPVFQALIPDGPGYGYFGEQVRSSDGWEAPIADYQSFLAETVVPYSHAKRALLRSKPLMVGSMARLALFADRLQSADGRNLYSGSALAQGDTNTIWNNLAQAIEVVEAIDRCQQIIDELSTGRFDGQQTKPDLQKRFSGSSVGAVECPRGTLFHSYTLDDGGTITQCDLVTPSVQNTRRIELDIREVVDLSTEDEQSRVQAHLETLVRAYDPCNTCATHMVRLNWSDQHS